MTSIRHPAGWPRRLAFWMALGCVPATVAQVTQPFPAELPDFGRVTGTAPFPQPDGTTILLGGTSRGFGVVRTRPDGTLDRNFGLGGLAELVIWGAAEYAHVLVRRPDGRLVVAGNAKDHTVHPQRCDYYYMDCNYHIVLFRLEADGQPDATFNGYGRLVLRVGDLPPAQTGGLEEGP